MPLQCARETCQDYPGLEEDERQEEGRHCQPSSALLGSAWLCTVASNTVPELSPDAISSFPCISALSFLCIQSERALDSSSWWLLATHFALWFMPSLSGAKWGSSNPQSKRINFDLFPFSVFPSSLIGFQQCIPAEWSSGLSTGAFKAHRSVFLKSSS